MKIGHLNVNGIYGKAEEVIDLLITCRFDIFFVAESKTDGFVNSSLYYLLIQKIALSVEIGRKVAAVCWSAYDGLLQPFAEENSNHPKWCRNNTFRR